MKKRIFKGSGVALVTPMHQDGTVNYKKFKELIDLQIAKETDALVICGTTGEAPTLTDDEHLEVIRVAVEHANGRLPVIAGTGSNNISHAIMMSKEAEKHGADGLLIVTPYYNKTSQQGLVKSYYAIADQVHIPIIVYHIPGRTGLTIAPQTFVELAKHENIVAVKEASGNIGTVAQIAALCGDSLEIYSGNDDQVVPLLSLGGIGVISTMSNVVPKETHDICQLFFDGKLEQSKTLQLQLLDLIDALFCEVNPIPVKEALNAMGLEVGSCRLPLCELSSQHKETLRLALKNHGLI